MKYDQTAAANITETEKTFRTLISNDPALSYFLETGSMQPNARFAEEAIYKETAFLAFISPYFQEVYVNAVISAFDMEDTDLMSDIAMNAILLDDVHRKQAFADILVYLVERKSVLALSHVTLQMQMQAHQPYNIFTIAEHTSISTFSNLNYLPVEFQEFRSSYARIIMQVINSLANRRLSTSMIMITNLRQLAVDVPTANDVEALYMQLNGNRQPNAIESGDDNSGYSGRNARDILSFVIIMVIIIIFTIFKISLWDNNGYHGGGYYHYHRTYHPSDHPSYHRNH